MATKARTNKIPQQVILWMTLKSPLNTLGKQYRKEKEHICPQKKQQKTNPNLTPKIDLQSYLTLKKTTCKQTTQTNLPPITNNQEKENHLRYTYTG
jgi:hypothetical protein